MPIIRAADLSGEMITSDLFGANILATIDRLGPSGTYDDVVESLGVTHVRYPGGSLAEQFFDLSDPTREIAESVITGQAISFLPYDDFMTWAEDNNLEVTIVIPTLSQLGSDASADSNGDRFAAVDEATLRGFISDTLDGVYGSPNIRAFEIGNEYFGSGEMTSVEYGRVASEIAVIIRDEIDGHPSAAAFSDTDILVQMGVNHGTAALHRVYQDVGTPEEQLAALEADYGMEFSPDRFLFSNGTVSWARVNSALVANEFDTVEEQESVDAIVAHVYGRGLDAPNTWYFDYRVIDETMVDNFPEVTKYVTEWNTRSTEFTTPEDEIYGLENAHEMLHILHAMTENGVEAAHVWPVQQNTATDLSGDEGQTELTVAGEMFRMMAESLPGTYGIDLAGSAPREDEVVTLDSDYWLFAGAERSSIFVFANSDAPGAISLDLSEVFSDLGQVSVERLGVQPGDDPASRDAQPDLEQIDPANVISGMEANVSLGSREIMHITFVNPTYTDSFAALIPEYTPPDDTVSGGEDGYVPGDDGGDIISGGEDGYEDPDPSDTDDVFAEDDDFDVGSLLGGLLLLPLLLALG